VKYIVKSAIITVAAICFLSAAVLAGEGNWGLGYPVPGSTPQGNESADYLKKFDAYFVGNAAERTLYLTFDAGFENGNTAVILDTLKSNNVPAAFFLVGTYIRDNPELIKRMAEEGHIVANHTMSHPDMSAIMDKAAFTHELTGTEEIYKSVTGSEMPKFYRPPSGKYSEENMKMAQEAGYKTIFWSLAYVDWNVDKQPTKEEAFAKLIPRVHPGAVILLHSTSKTNALILDELIKRYRDMGYEFRGIEELGR